MISVIIPSCNEPYLAKTIKDLLKKAVGEIEIIAVLDGWWPKAEDIVSDKRVRYIHYSNQRGMRNAINKGVEVAKGEFILKCDAHCMFAPEYDKMLTKYHKPFWVVVPRRYALDPIKWEIIDNPKYPIDYMYLDSNLHGVEWREKNKDPKLAEKKIDFLMSSQGSCWFMTKAYYKMLRLLDEEHYGMFWNEFQEIGLKVWTYQGQVVVNKHTWYAHWHKTERRGYNLPNADHEKAVEWTNKWKTNLAWVEQQRNSLAWLIKRFWPVPTWDPKYIEHEERDSEVMFWRKWMQIGRGKRRFEQKQLAPHIVEMIGDKKEVSIVDLGGGAVPMVGYETPGVKVNYVMTDLLAEEYKEVYRYHNYTPPFYPEYQDMTKLSYKDETFDIVHCRNAIDHCPDAWSALKEMYRVCKKGGYVYLWHFEDVARMMQHTGMHQWNIHLEGQDCRFISKTKSFLLSECVPGFINSRLEYRHGVIVNKLHKV